VGRKDTGFAVNPLHGRTTVEFSKKILYHEKFSGFELVGPHFHTRQSHLQVRKYNSSYKLPFIKKPSETASSEFAPWKLAPSELVLSKLTSSEFALLKLVPSEMLPSKLAPSEFVPSELLPSEQTPS
jgi:hypothetical protein